MQQPHLTRPIRDEAVQRHAEGGQRPRSIYSDLLGSYLSVCPHARVCVTQMTDCLEKVLQ